MSAEVQGQMTLFDDSPPQRAQMQYVGVAPTRAYDDDAGFDLTVAMDYEVPAHGIGKIPLATTIKSAPGYWGMMVGRSSAFARGLLVNVGIIDAGYTGPLFGVVHNMTDHPIVIREGERIVQWVPFRIHADEFDLHQADALPNTARGSNGFGSSGK